MSAPKDTRFLRELAAPGAPDLRADRVALVVAHPDDETIGVGGQLSRLRSITVIHATDGSPRAHSEHRAYARQRRRELEAAMALAGVSKDALVALGFIDQEVSLHLAELTRRLAGLFDERRVAIVMTHPYEGGHPDHDAVSFAVHAAREIMARKPIDAPDVIEMAFYHGGPAGMVAQRFVPADVPTIELPLSDAAWALKRRMLAAHASQVDALTQFDSRVERFRVAPSYDFGALPNGGSLYYETADWGMTGARWQELAAAACRELGVECATPPPADSPRER
ncbi:MAG: PIG-L deacetylase family protein [Stellaceae bacterium]